MSTRTAAIITFYNVPAMDGPLRKRVVAWLQGQADAVMQYGKDWAAQERRYFEQGDRRITLTVRDGADMTGNGRKDIAAWIRKQAAFVVADGDAFSAKLIARYRYDG